MYYKDKLMEKTNVYRESEKIQRLIERLSSLIDAKLAADGTAHVSGGAGGDTITAVAGDRTAPCKYTTISMLRALHNIWLVGWLCIIFILNYNACSQLVKG